MAELVRTLNLTATFAKLQEGESVDIGLNDATESNVRAAASRYSREKKIILKVKALRGADKITVTRRT